MEIRKLNIPPSSIDYCHLRKICGMSEKSIEAAEIGLKHACFNVTLYDDTLLIGMGRVIGDGATAFQIIDIAVHPDYQKQGYGKQIMKEIMSFIEEVQLPGTYVSLIADHPAEHLYQQFGFQMTAPASQGMYVHYPYHSD
ncbi:GNAT family N-acetyltransferase [Staphylococcus canis]|uniref:GNAT family N-acetyltransferase n=1 Tax=Staphylococcus canis TaxID=2724942 RepID=A0ABS0T6D9_9STAP|nr:GNAT family N-acetyltransferase [Staphylococcus canis]MBI5974313.1 GNAT family N-acetyltransferase [Staphylococcus canis]